MGIAVDQTRLHRITRALLPEETLRASEALAMLEILRIAAGADGRRHAQEQAVLHAVTQCVCQLAGLEPDEPREVPHMLDGGRRLELLAEILETPGAKELAYALSLIVSVADLEKVPTETAHLEHLQHALGIDHRRATDLTVLVVEAVADAT
jgi:hypothetical protein